MTMINQGAASQLNAGSERVIEVSWSCTVTRWIDRFGLFAKGQRHGTVAFVASLRIGEGQGGSCAGTLAAWLVMGERRKAVLEESPVVVGCLEDGELLHVDVMLEGDGGERVLAVSCCGEELMFAQSALLREAGFEGGSYDPPVIVTAASRCAAAIA